MRVVVAIPLSWLPLQTGQLSVRETPGVAVYPGENSRGKNPECRDRQLGKTSMRPVKVAGRVQRGVHLCCRRLRRFPLRSDCTTCSESVVIIFSSRFIASRSGKWPHSHFKESGSGTVSSCSNQCIRPQYCSETYNRVLAYSPLSGDFTQRDAQRLCHTLSIGRVGLHAVADVADLDLLGRIAHGASRVFEEDLLLLGAHHP